MSVREKEFNMNALEGVVEVAYFVRLEGLYEICRRLTNERREYKVDSCDGRAVVIGFNEGPDDLNCLRFSFPVVRNLNVKRMIPCLGERWPFGDGGLIVCLHVYTGTLLKGGLYIEDGVLDRDILKDWERFWFPLESALHIEPKREGPTQIRRRF